MYQYKGLEDTIVAVATACGQGAIGIIRMSGKSTFAIAEKVIRLQSKKPLTSCQSHKLYRSFVVHRNNEEMIDDVLVVLMRAPHSYTAEDMVEIHGHGGMTVLYTVLEAVLNAGARLAQPGEFTKRAFLNGRMDLPQAEAVIDVINAKTESFLRQSHYQLKGELSSRLKNIREELISIYTMIEALINFPEDGIDTKSHDQILDRLDLQQKDVAQLLKASESGRILKNGIRIVLCGKPNVGKSSLMNILLKVERAIVTPIAGTTRDVLEEFLEIQQIPINLVDTAGILEPRDMIEEEAVKRSRLYIDSADFILLVLDQSRPLEQEDISLLEKLSDQRVLIVANKIDLTPQMDYSHQMLANRRMVKVSAFQLPSIRELEGHLVEMIKDSRNLSTDGLLISNIRHIKSLEAAEENLAQASRLLKGRTSLEFISEEIKQAINQLDAITGRNIDEDLLERIFSEFCIGK